MKKKVTIIIPIIIIAIIFAIIITIGIINSKKNTTIPVSAREIKDTVPPVITLKGEKEITLKKGEIYREIGYSAIDDTDGSIVSKVAISKKRLADNKYKIIYSVADRAGNYTKEERIIQTEPEKKKGIIYLTFDDGPSMSSTPKILNILKKHNVKATFFILNYGSQTEQLVKREIAEGHSVGIHGYSHDYEKIYQSENAYMDNLNKLQSKIYQSTGIKTTITRFPGGSSNTISSFNPGIMTKLSKKVVQNGYQYYDWNVDSNDAGNAKDAETVYKNVTKELYKDGRNIVLMHDFSGNNKTVDALERIIQYGKKNGYIFKAITSDTEMMKHNINN